jgi:cell division protein FtsL
MTRLAAAVLAALLLASAMGLVASRYRARSLVAEGEIARREAKSLESEGARLRSELGHHAQPAMIEAQARAAGLRPIGPERTVLLAAPAPAIPTAIADAGGAAAPAAEAAQ